MYYGGENPKNSLKMINCLPANQKKLVHSESNKVSPERKSAKNGRFLKENDAF